MRDRPIMTAELVRQMGSVAAWNAIASGEYIDEHDLPVIDGAITGYDDDLLDVADSVGLVPAGEPWGDVPLAELAAVAHAASAAPLVVFDADPWGTPSARHPVSAELDEAGIASPIHRDLLATIILGPPVARYYRAPWRCEVGIWTITAERPVGRYRVDIAIESAAGRVAVEADGHEYHERTPEQAERDRRRDRALQADGWVVLRFTGREIWRDVDACAREVFAQMDRLCPGGRHG